jgi:DNA-binding FrmR family transcriptional regulator
MTSTAAVGTIIIPTAEEGTERVENIAGVVEAVHTMIEEEEKGDEITTGRTAGIRVVSASQENRLSN